MNSFSVGLVLLVGTLKINLLRVSVETLQVNDSTYYLESSDTPVEKKSTYSRQRIMVKLH